MYPKYLATWRKANRNNKRERIQGETAWNGSIVKAISLSPRPNYNSAPLGRSEGPNRDCRRGVERALRQDTETDASTTITCGTLLIQLTSRLVL
jgi:hypothetical protein